MKTNTQPGAAVSAQPSPGALRAADILAALRNIADVAEKMVDQNGSAQAAFIRDEARAAIAAVS